MVTKTNHFTSFYNLPWPSMFFHVLLVNFYNLLVTFMTFESFLWLVPTLPLKRMWLAQLIPIIFRKFLNILELSAFVSLSAHISLIEIYEMTISFCSTFSQIQYQRTLISFVFRWNLGFSISKIAPLLSARRSTGWLDSQNLR